MNSKATKFAAMILGLAVSVAIAFIGARFYFARAARERLQREAEMQVLRFESQLNGEIKLAVQMAMSPVVVNFMKNPKDEFYSVAGVDEIRKYQDSFLGKNSFWASTADDVFWSNLQPLYTIDKEDPSQYWYKMTLYETDVFNFNINYNDEMKQTCLWLNAVVRDEKSNPIGMCGTGIPLDGFIGSLFTSIESDDSITMYTFNNLTEITGATDRSLIESKALIVNELPEIEGYEAYSDKVRYVSSLGGECILMPMTSIGWTLVMKIPFNVPAFFASAALPFGILILLIFIVSIVIVSLRLFRPLNALNRTVQDLSFGNADLTRRINMNLDGTLSVVQGLVNGFNTFIEKIQATVKTLKESEDLLDSSRLMLNNGTAEVVDSINKINSDIETFSQTIGMQSDSVSQTTSAVNQISQSISSLDGLIATQNSAVENASGAVEKMVGNIKTVNSSVERLSGSFSALEANTADGVAKHENMNHKIAQIQEQSIMLAEANAVISAIAEQTNLLAMNAAIEAAHAGEAGKGFSVVADEIRKLSENSSSQSKTISEELSEIQKSIQDVVSSSVETGNSFKVVSDKISETTALVLEITRAMKEQESGSKLMSDSVFTLNSSSSQVRKASREMSEGSKAILNEIQVLQDTTADMDSRMADLDSKSRAMKKTQDSLSSISSKMDKAIATMNVSLEKFRV